MENREDADAQGATKKRKYAEKTALRRVGARRFATPVEPHLRWFPLLRASL
jgi:hypothetical protein